MPNQTSNRPIRSITVVALGGHALLPKNEQSTMELQFRYAGVAMQRILDIVESGTGLVITHGNGPQVGHILARSEAAAGEAYTIPLSVAVAESEGEIGYVVQQSLYNALAERQIQRPIVTVLTQVLVDRHDPAFSVPTKPIGPFHDDDEAKELLNQGIAVQNFPGSGWRRVVASPSPIRIIEGETVRRLATEDVVVIAAGGGGIPVEAGEDGSLRGVDAVIDKDLASSVLARDINANRLLMLTDVDKVYLNFGTEKQRGLLSMTTSEAVCYADEGHFPPGSMGPKVQGAVDFVRECGGEALITAPDSLRAALRHEAGTWITS